MVDERAWESLLREIMHHFRDVVQEHLEKFTRALRGWMIQMTSRPLPADWRRQTAAFLSEWEQKGYHLSPESIALVEWWIEGRAPRRAGPPSRSIRPGVEKLTLKGGKLTSTFTRVEEDAEEEEQEDPKRSNWPELSPADREAAQRGTGLPWWYPIQPRNRMDPMFERMFIDLGRTARDRLLDFYRTMALLGRMGLALKHDEEADPEAADVDLDAIDAQRQRAQDAYDRYIEAKAKVYDLRVGYLNGATFVGPEVEMVFMRIDNALPNRIDELTSENDGRLKAAYHAARTAVQAKRRRTDAAYTALFWTDVVITIIEIATLLASVKAVFTAAAKKAVAKGLSEAAARKVAATYAVAHLATAAASAVAVATALPAVLRGAGLDEAEVRAGLALMRGFATIVGARAMLKQRPPSNPVGRHTLPDKLPDGKGLSVPPKLSAGRAFDASRARDYPYNQVRVENPRGSHFILDSYDPIAGEIVSRKKTQLADIKLKSAMAYLTEFARKYPPGRRILPTPNAGKVGGELLRGKMILEVPLQMKPIPKAVLDKATQLKITIRDVHGHAYN